MINVPGDRRADVDHYAFRPLCSPTGPEDAPPLPLPLQFCGALVGLGAKRFCDRDDPAELQTLGNFGFSSFQSDR